MERGADWDEVRAAAGNLSLFGSRRLVEIRLPTGKPGTGGNSTLADLLERERSGHAVPDSHAAAGSRCAGADWVRTLESRGAWVQVWPVDARSPRGWLRAPCPPDEARSRATKRWSCWPSAPRATCSPPARSCEKLQLLAPGGACGRADRARERGRQRALRCLSARRGRAGGDAPRALRVLGGLRAEGVEPTLALWSLTKAMRDIWGAIASAGRIQAPSVAAPGGRAGQGRAPRAGACRSGAGGAGRRAPTAWSRAARRATPGTRSRFWRRTSAAIPAVPAPQSMLK